MRHCDSKAAGFTLIEVLIGVMVLALGLLGLGAVIPVVVSEQRKAMESQLGLEAVKSARAYLTNRPDLDPTTPFQFTTGTNPQPKPTIGWDIWLMDKQNWSVPAPSVQNAPVDCYLWEPWKVGNTPGPNVEMTLPTGDFSWDAPSTSPPSTVYATITLGDRLWPGESVQGADYIRHGLDPHKPLFVWDFIGRRVHTQPGQPEQLQVAIFVRRLDLNIRIPRGINPTTIPAQTYTLRDVVLNRLPAGSPAAAVPVCSYVAGSGPQEYLSTGTGQLANGTPSYSEIITLGDQASGVTLWFDPAVNPAWLELIGLPLTDNRWKLVSRPGQKLVDNLGNVYTVRGTLEELDPAGAQQNPGQPILVIDPPIPSFVPDPNLASLPANSPGSLRQVIFTPQPPAAVDVFTITRTLP